MTWTGEHGSPPDPVDRGSAPRPGTAPGALTVPAVGWLLAAGLAMVAPFLNLATMSVDAPGSRDDRTTSIDGWGRTHPLTSMVNESHGVQLGILLWMCAGGLVVGGLLLLLRRRDPEFDADDTGAPHPLGLLAVGAPAALSAAALSSYLAADSLVSQVGTSAGRSGPAFHAGYGPAVWVAVAAAVVAITATALYLRRGPVDDYLFDGDPSDRLTG